MIIETKLRTLTKAITWRITATLTTIVLVYLFTGRVGMALQVGAIEVVLKIIFYFLHDRGWNKIKFGKKKFDPFVVWFTGLPVSGKTSIANRVFELLKNKEFELERIDSHDVRGMFPEVGFEREDRILHLKRVSFLVKMLEKNKVSVIASFVTPYKEARDVIRDMIDLNYIEVYVKTPLETCKIRDTRGVYERAERGEIRNFTGISDTYDEPIDPDIILDTEQLSVEESARRVIQYLQKNNHI
jgi:adenylylsulfate kinase